MDARMGGQLRPQKMELDSILDLRWDDFGSPDPHDKEMWGGGCWAAQSVRASVFKA